MMRFCPICYKRLIGSSTGVDPVFDTAMCTVGHFRLELMKTTGHMVTKFWVGETIFVMDSKKPGMLDILKEYSKAIWDHPDRAAGEPPEDFVEEVCKGIMSKFADIERRIDNSLWEDDPELFFKTEEERETCKQCGHRCKSYRCPICNNFKPDDWLGDDNEVL